MLSISLWHTSDSILSHSFATLSHSSCTPFVVSHILEVFTWHGTRGVQWDWVWGLSRPVNHNDIIIWRPSCGHPGDMFWVIVLLKIPLPLFDICQDPKITKLYFVLCSRLRNWRHFIFISWHYSSLYTWPTSLSINLFSWLCPYYYCASQITILQPISNY